MTEHLVSICPVLELYGGLTGLGSPELDDAIISDLIADLMHWSDRRGWNFEELYERGYKHYFSEQNEA